MLIRSRRFLRLDRMRALCHILRNKKPTLASRDDVQIAVTVIVKKRNAGAHDFGQVILARRTVKVLETQTGLGGDIAKARFRSFARMPATYEEAEQERSGDRVRPHFEVRCSILARIVSIWALSWLWPKAEARSPA